MKRLSLFPGAVPSTALGFGTTRLMALPGTKERLAVLEAAHEAGITHFDTAPYYGYGEAERILGEFAAGRRDQLTITTKYGIQPPAIIKARFVNLLARRILRLLPPLKKRLSRAATAMTKKSGFTAAAARQSLDQSLAALKTDRVDLFLLHEPAYTDAASEEIRGFLEEETGRGRIRSYGCGGDLQVIQNIAAARLPTAAWLQFEDNVLNPGIETVSLTGAKCITFGAFRRPLELLARWLESMPGRREEWERELQMDLRAPGALAGLLQAVSHFRNPEGIVLFSTSRPDRIAPAVQAAENQFSRGQIETFAALAIRACASH